MSTADGVVLVVDDEEESRRIARRHLDKLGWEVAEAEDGAGALSMARAEPAPGDDPARSLDARHERLRFSRRDRQARRDGADIPIVILTAMPLGAAERELLGGRTREVIAKGADDLAQVLRRVLRAPAEGGRKSPRPADVGNGMAKILIVEDNEMNRDMLSRRLIRRGYEIVMAVDGAEGIAAAKAENPDLVLMDMSLPVVDGWEATRGLKAEPLTRAIPVIGLTAHAMAGDRERVIEAGCDDYDTKPVELPRLLQKIEALLARTERSGRERRAARARGRRLSAAGVRRLRRGDHRLCRHPDRGCARGTISRTAVADLERMRSGRSAAFCS